MESLAINASNTTVEWGKCEALFTNTSVGLKATFYFLIFTFSITGNIFVIINVNNKRRPTASTTSILIKSMAVSDLFVAFLAVPREIFEILTRTETWHVRGVPGVILCKGLFFLTDISPLVSVLSLDFITIERFAKVVYPLSWIVVSGRTYHRVTIITSWIVPGLFLCYYFYIFKLVVRGKEAYCGVEWQPLFDPKVSLKVFGSLTVILFFIFPTVLISLLYTGIIRQLKREPFRDNPLVAQKLRVNFSKLAVSVVVTFILCFAPFYVGIFLSTSNITVVTCRVQIFWFIARTMAFANAAINPWIYILLVRNTWRNTRVGVNGGNIPLGVAEANNPVLVGALERDNPLDMAEGCYRMGNANNPVGVA